MSTDGGKGGKKMEPKVLPGGPGKVRSLSPPHKPSPKDVAKYVAAVENICTTKKISIKDFNIEGKLGEGGFGEVYLAQLKENI